MFWMILLFTFYTLFCVMWCSCEAALPLFLFFFLFFPGRFTRVIKIWWCDSWVGSSTLFSSTLGIIIIVHDGMNEANWKLDFSRFSPSFTRLLIFVIRIGLESHLVVGQRNLCWFPFEFENAPREMKIDNRFWKLYWLILLYVLVNLALKLLCNFVWIGENGSKK
jgi:hypothetical protein